jgi:O-antigen/teichoic acid export membrane protein
MMETTQQSEGDLLVFSADSRTVKTSAVNSIFIQLLLKLKGIITMPVMTYFLTPAEFGAYNIILVTSSMLVPLFSLNLTDGPAIHFVQEKSRERIVTMYNTVTNSVLLFSLCLLPLLWLVMHRLGGAYFRYLPLMALLLYSNLFYKVVTYMLAVFQKTTLLVNNALLKEGAGTVLSIALVAAGYSYSGMIAVAVLMNLGAGMLVYRVTRRDLVYRCVIDRKILLQFLKIALPLLPVFFFSWVIQSSDSYFLAYFKGEQAVGKYSIIYGLTSVILSITLGLNYFWFPVSARLWVENREKYRKAFMAMFAGFVAVLFTAVTLFELNSRLIMHLMVRRAEYHDAYTITGIIAFAFAMQVLITLLTAPLYSNGNTATIFTTYLCGGLVNTALNILLIPSSGIMGAAVSTALSYLVIVLLMAWMNYRSAGFAFFDRRLVPVTLIFLAAWGAAARMRDALQPYQLLLSDAALLLVVALLLYKVALRGKERDYLHDMYHDFRLQTGTRG